MRYRILGPLEVRDGRRIVDPGGPRHRALLALLLARANEIVSVDYLVDRLWPGHPPDRARAALQVYVSELRRALQPRRPARARDNVLVTQPPGYRLVVKPGALDAHEFERLVKQASAARRAGDLSTTAGLLRDALDLWRGPALSDVAVDELDATLATRLHHTRLAALEDRIDAELRLGQHEELTGELTALIIEHPFRERLYAQLMVASYRCGRPVEALQTFRRLRNVLTDELGIEPSPVLQRLQRAILAGSPAEGLPPSISAAVVEDHGRTAFPR